MPSEQHSADSPAGVDRAAVFEVLPAPHVVLTPDLVVADMNAAYVAVTGRDRKELIGQYFLTAFPPPPDSLDEHGRSELQISLERVRDTGRPDTLPVQRYPISGPDGVLTERRWSAVHVPVLDDEGQVVFIVQRTEDITEFALDGSANEHSDDDDWQARAKRVESDLFVRARELADAIAAKDVAARRVASLAEASLALAAATSLTEIERIVVGRALPVLGSDGGGLVTPDDRGGWRITVNEALGEHVQTTYPDAPYDSMIPGCWCARTGERLLLPTRADGLTFDAEVMADIYANTDRSAWAFEPLVVGERRLGSLAVSWVDEYELATDELDLLAGFAAQCAQAMLRVETERADRAAAREVQQLAEALQQALLTPPPQPDHLHVVARYRSAGDHAQIGGDWYDAFLQPDGATMLVIGDVVGHDSRAAAKMGQLRGVLRTLAYDADSSAGPDSPSAILTRLDRVSRGLAVDTLATVVLARIEQPDDTAGRTMRWANAGHLPPVLLHADGTVDVLETDPELLLGFDPSAPRSDHTLDLPDESTLLLYTDGLVERRGTTFDESLTMLRGALADLGGADVNELCDTVLARLAPEAGDDDIALIAVRAHTENRPRPGSAGPETVPNLLPPTVPATTGKDDVVLDLPFDDQAPGLARHFVKSHAAGLPDPVREDAELLVSELVTNAIRYGLPEVTVQLRNDSDVLGVLVTDSGAEQPVLPDGRPDPDAPSGRGLLIIAAVADEWGVLHDADTGGKSVWFRLRSSR